MRSERKKFMRQQLLFEKHLTKTAQVRTSRVAWGPVQCLCWPVSKGHFFWQREGSIIHSYMHEKYVCARRSSSFIERITRRKFQSLSEFDILQHCFQPFMMQEICFEELQLLFIVLDKTRQRRNKLSLPLSSSYCCLKHQQPKFWFPRKTKFCVKKAIIRKISSLASDQHLGLEKQSPFKQVKQD